MSPRRSHLRGDSPGLAAVVVGAVGVLVALLLAPFGVLERSVSGPTGRAAFVLAFTVLPGLVGGVCGWYRLGLPAAVGSGVAPGATFYGVVAAGSALGIGSFGGGDTPLAPFALALTTPSLVAAVGCFAVATGVTIRRG